MESATLLLPHPVGSDYRRDAFAEFDIRLVGKGLESVYFHFFEFHSKNLYEILYHVLHIKAIYFPSS